MNPRATRKRGQWENGVSVQILTTPAILRLRFPDLGQEPLHCGRQFGRLAVPVEKFLSRWPEFRGPAHSAQVEFVDGVDGGVLVLFIAPIMGGVGDFMAVGGPHLPVC